MSLHFKLVRVVPGRLDPHSLALAPEFRRLLRNRYCEKATLAAVVTATLAATYDTLASHSNADVLHQQRSRQLESFNVPPGDTQ